MPFWLIAALAAAYIACIGPLDYYLVKRVFGRMESTWLTFSLTAVLFSAGAVALAYGLKGRELTLNQVDVVDFDAESSLVRGTTWANLYSPRIDTYDLSLDDAPAVGESAAGDVLLSWMGLPGSGFGGMNGTTAALPLFSTPYDFSPRLDQMQHVPIAIWSSKALVARWRAMRESPIIANLSDRGRLVGTFTSQLDDPLGEAVLMYDRWAYPLRELRPGQSVDVESQLDPQTADTYLRHVTAQGERNVVPPYDRASFDVPRIVEVMSAFQLAGGERYTGLTNDYQGYFDVSTLVRNGRAVLIGRSSKPAARLARDGQRMAGPADGRWTFYRFVLPVKDRTDVGTTSAGAIGKLAD